MSLAPTKETLALVAEHMEETRRLRTQNTRLRNALADLLSERRGSGVTEEDDETAVERIARGALDEKEGG